MELYIQILVVACLTGMTVATGASLSRRFP